MEHDAWQFIGDASLNKPETHITTDVDDFPACRINDNDNDYSTRNDSESILSRLSAALAAAEQQQQRNS